MLGSGASAEISEPATSAVPTAAVDQINGIHRNEVTASSHVSALAIVRRHEANLPSEGMLLIRPIVAGSTWIVER